MERRIGRWIGGWVSGLAGAILLALGLFTELSTIPELNKLLVSLLPFPVSVLIWAGIVLIVFQAFAPRIELNRYLNALPSITVEGTPVTFHNLALAWQESSPSEPEQAHRLVLRGSMPISQYDVGELGIRNAQFFHIEFVNNKAAKDGVFDAVGVRAWITFYSATSHLAIISFPGRWEGKEPLYVRRAEDGRPIYIKKEDDLDELLATSIPADGFTKRRLNVAVRFGDTSFAFNNDWYDLYEFTGENFALPEERYFVLIKLGGGNTRHDDFWFELVNRNDITLKPTRVNWWLRRALTGKKGIKGQPEQAVFTRKDLRKVVDKATVKPPKKKRR